MPSPSDSLDYPISPTMFSPDPSKDDRRYTASPSSSFGPASPFSPGSRMERKISTASSGLTDSVDMSNINLQESLLEFTQLQDRIKKDQDLALSLDSGLSSTFPGPLNPQAFELGHSAPAYPDSSSSAGVKLEPLDFLDMDKSLMSPPSFSSMTSHALQQQAPGPSNLLLKQCLQDRSFETKYNLKPFDFGVTTGFVSERSNSKAAISRSEQKEEEEKADVKIEPVLDLAVEQVKKDIESTCNILSISSGESSYKVDFKKYTPWAIQERYDTVSK